jgi:hypothetical protein
MRIVAALFQRDEMKDYFVGNWSRLRDLELDRGVCSQ